jgi:pimeloyl-ACP methyl ester carboxylesterase
MGVRMKRRRATRAALILRVSVLSLGLSSGVAFAEEVVPGIVVGDVQCEDKPAQHYALYLPSNYTPARQWPVIFAFDPTARGLLGVERYRAAAEKHGYIVAGSNNSRNGLWEPSLEAAAAMTADVRKRFAVDPRRMYTAGMSGGARVAIMVALRTPTIAGVLASSAGYADSFRDTVRFPFFGTAGTEDFNYREMHAVDLRMKSPHRVEVFVGGHVWLPAHMAMDGVEWMELQAMRSGLKPRDERLIDELFAQRVARSEAHPDKLARMRQLNQIARDFADLKDVSGVQASVTTLEQQPDVVGALASEHEDDILEAQVSETMNRLLRQLSWPERERQAFATLQAHVNTLVEASWADEDSTDRRIARRTLAGLRASARGIPHDDLRDLMRQVELPDPPPIE